MNLAFSIRLGWEYRKSAPAFIIAVNCTYDKIKIGGGGIAWEIL